MKKVTPLSHIELSKKNLIHNIKQFRSLVKSGTKISVAIKGNAYGHGQNAVARILEPHVDYFQVDSIEELALLRKISQKKTFLFGYVQKTDLSKAVKLGCILSIFSLEQLRELDKVTRHLKKKQEIHIPFDAHLGGKDSLKKLPLLKEIKNTGMWFGIYFAISKIPNSCAKQINEF